MKLRTAQSNLIIYKQTQGLLEIISNCDYLGGKKKEKEKRKERIFHFIVLDYKKKSI